LPATCQVLRVRSERPIAELVEDVHARLSGGTRGPVA
jgi:hypothetical protein